MSADRDPAEKGWSNVPAKPPEQSSAQTRKVLTGNGPPVSAAVSPVEPPEASYYTLTDAEREVIVRHERRSVCSWCGEDHEGDPDSASDCCMCDLVPASSLPSLLKDARREAQEAVDAVE